jgi:hypothetical protein
LNEIELMEELDWVRINNSWMCDAGDLSVSVRWTGGTWHWRAVSCDGSLETARLAGESRRDQPNGYIQAEDAMRAAERWLATQAK